jgi:nucleoside-diphosphate-sugar epimerase
MAGKPSTLYADCERSLAGAGTGGLDKLRGTTLFIAGGSGFVGLWISVLVAYLNDHHDFRTTIVAAARRRARAADQAPFLLSRSDYSFVQADIRQIADLPRDTGWIVNAAGSPDSRQHATDPVNTMSVFSEGTERLLRIAEQLVQLKAVLHFSSSAVYDRGSPAIAPQREAAAPLDATTAYAEAKRFGEVLCAAFRTQARLPIVVTRPFTFIGPFQPLDAPWAVNHFLHAALESQPLKVQGAGDSVRTLLYGSDMAVLALHQLVGGKSGAVYNLGAVEALTLREMAEMVVTRAGRPLEVRYNTAGKTLAASRLTPDMSKSQAEFKLTPAFSAADAISRTLAWHA